MNCPNPSYCEYIERQARYYQTRIDAANSERELEWWKERKSQLEQEQVHHILEDHEPE
jgi:hypothetical protein